MCELNPFELENYDEAECCTIPCAPTPYVRARWRLVVPQQHFLWEEILSIDRQKVCFSSFYHLFQCL